MYLLFVDHLSRQPNFGPILTQPFHHYYPRYAPPAIIMFYHAELRGDAGGNVCPFLLHLMPLTNKFTSRRSTTSSNPFYNSASTITITIISSLIIGYYPSWTSSLRGYHMPIYFAHISYFTKQSTTYRASKFTSLSTSTLSSTSFSVPPSPPRISSPSIIDI